jgi:hypothetical protein
MSIFDFGKHFWEKKSQYSAIPLLEKVEQNFGSATPKRLAL